MIKFLWITLTATLMADIGILESLKTRAIGEGGERVTLKIDSNDLGDQIEGTELNLPEKFDVKVSEHWWIENGNKPSDHNAIREFNRPYIFHFRKNNFIFSDTKHRYSGGEWGSHYQATVGKGTIHNNVLSGKFITTGYSYTENNLLHFLWTSKEKSSGKVEKNGITHLISNNITIIKCKMRENKGEGWSSLHACDSATYTSLKRFLSNVRAHYLLQLPINQSQSSQKYMTDTLAEPDPSQEQPTTIPKVSLSPNIGASPKAIEPKPEPEEKAYEDEAIKEFHKKEAANKKEYQEKLKKWEQENESDRKAEKEYQTKLAKYNEEERQINLKVIRENEKNRARIKKIEAQENQAFHNKLAKEMQERKAKQAEIKIAHDIVDRFGEGDPESRRLSHKKIDELSKNADSEKATKIKNAMRKQYYDSKQTKLQGEAEYQTAKAKEIDKKGKRVELIRDTSLTANKVLAKLDPTGVGDKIVEIQENVGNLIDAAEKGGIEGVIVKSTSIVTNKFTKDIGGDIIEKTHKQIKDYNENGIKLDKSDKVYDKDGNRLTRYKKGDRAYNKNKEEVSFSTGRKALSNIFFDVADGKNPIKKAEDAVKNIEEGIAEGDFNKAVNAGLDLNDAKESIDGGTDSVVKKLEGL